MIAFVLPVIVYSLATSEVLSKLEVCQSRPNNVHSREFVRAHSHVKLQTPRAKVGAAKAEGQPCSGNA